LSGIDEEAELSRYKEEVLSKARETMGEDDIAYIEEDLRSPCTQEIAVFRAFAQIIERSKDEIVIVDTAPTGHTLLLLDSALSYHREIERSQGDVPGSCSKYIASIEGS
jgi:arsenite-transporting ATPase